MNEEKIKLKAVAFAKKERKRIANELTDLKFFHPDKIPISVFMAGSPGAGKTEFSKNIISILERKSDRHVIRIDGDDLRSQLPGYTGANSYLFQGAISLIIEKIHDFVLAKKQSFILDGTFSKYKIAEKNVMRSLNKQRPVFIFYVYQNPKTAWYFTEKREKSEGRNIPKKAFIEQFFGAQKTVEQIKNKFKKNVTVVLLKKDFKKNTVDKIVEIQPTEQLIDKYLKENYTKNELEKIL
ncbi:MAG: zeta toxin family protein [Patescibacteria group bacterium]